VQFLPGVIATPYWAGANRKGLLAGLAGGLGIWFLVLLLPVVTGNPPLVWHLTGPTGSEEALWASTTLTALALNVTLFIVVSVLTHTIEEEKVAAEICSMDDQSRPTRQVLSVQSAGEFSAHLASALGEKTACAEVQRALDELQFSATEARPYALRRLRARIEANLSGLLGPAVAYNIIERCIPLQRGLSGLTEDINLIERKLDRAQSRFTGLAADLDALRRHYRGILDKLPIGVCSMGADGELVMWNRSMARITGIPAKEVLGSLQDSLPQPWCSIINEFKRGDEDTLLKTEVVTEQGESRWITLHRTSADRDGSPDQADTVILVEDITDFELLEEELLHSERLASIGRLAAGVAHEIGNPITGIACLAQNLEYETDPDEIRQTADDILKQTARVSRIVESLVNFSHTGSGAGESRLEPSNLADCVDEAIQLLTLDRQARPVEFRNLCDRELLALADGQRLLQVLVNLLGNARDACSDYGKVEIGTREEGDRVVIEVEDNGCGIAPESLGQVFEPFYTTKDPGDGTGLGLALVYSIMEDMSGTVQITSPVGPAAAPGTRVTLRLPSASYGDELLAL
jgi:PAS domain S-box-containing protein